MQIWVLNVGSLSFFANAKHPVRQSTAALVFVGSAAGLVVSLQRLILRDTILLPLPSGRIPHGAVALGQSIFLRSIVSAALCAVFGGGRCTLFLVCVP